MEICPCQRTHHPENLIKATPKAGFCMLTGKLFLGHVGHVVSLPYRRIGSSMVVGCWLLIKRSQVLQSMVPWVTYLTLLDVTRQSRSRVGNVQMSSSSRLSTTTLGWNNVIDGNLHECDHHVLLRISGDNRLPEPWSHSCRSLHARMPVPCLDPSLSLCIAQSDTD